MIRGFPEMMKKKRKSMSISIEELSNKLDIPKRTLYNYEKGSATPSTITFLRICSVLKINPNIFMK